MAKKYGPPPLKLAKPKPKTIEQLEAKRERIGKMIARMLMKEFNRDKRTGIKS